MINMSNKKIISFIASIFLISGMCVASDASGAGSGVGLLAVEEKNEQRKQQMTLFVASALGKICEIYSLPSTQQGVRQAGAAAGVVSAALDTVLVMNAETTSISKALLMAPNVYDIIVRSTADRLTTFGDADLTTEDIKQAKNDAVTALRKTRNQQFFHFFINCLVRYGAVVMADRNYDKTSYAIRFLFAASELVRQHMLHRAFYRANHIGIQKITQSCTLPVQAASSVSKENSNLE